MSVLINENGFFVILFFSTIIKSLDPCNIPNEKISKNPKFI
jgi:hypothetical protein